MVEAEPRAATGPPAIPFVLAVGVTGHRAEVLAQGDVDRLRELVRETLILIEESGRSLLERERDCFAPGPVRLRFVSPIADGADQIAATLALELGWELQAIIPFSREQYRASLASDDARDRFDALLERSACLLELPGDPDDSLDAYIMTGRPPWRIVTCSSRSGTASRRAAGEERERSSSSP